MSLDEKSKELVAIGAAIGGNCIPCLEWHFNRCIEVGFTQEEIQEAIDLANIVKEVPIENINETAQKLIKDMYH